VLSGTDLASPISLAMPTCFWGKSGAIPSSHQALLIGTPLYFLHLFEISCSFCTRLYDGPPYYEAGLKFGSTLLYDSQQFWNLNRPKMDNIVEIFFEIFLKIIIFLKKNIFFKMVCQSTQNLFMAWWTLSHGTEAVLSLPCAMCTTWWLLMCDTEYAGCRTWLHKLVWMCG
jgi:hypothetical protein